MLKKNIQHRNEQILVLRDGQLLSLRADVRSLQAANFIGNYCTRLYELELLIAKQDGVYFDYIFRKVGKTLRELKFPRYLSRHEMSAIRNHCTSMSSMYLSCEEGIVIYGESASILRRKP